MLFNPIFVLILCATMTRKKTGHRITLLIPGLLISKCSLSKKISAGKEYTKYFEFACMYIKF